MNLSLLRFSFQEKCTIGHWLIEEQDCGLFSLEDKVREIQGKPVSEWKIPDETAIPKGRYRVVINFSAHFQRDLPLLLEVPGYEGVRIHPGNKDADTEGCLLPGKTWSGGDFIGQSRDAFEFLFTKIKSAIDSGEEVWLEVA